VNFTGKLIQEGSVDINITLCDRYCYVATHAQ